MLEPLDAADIELFVDEENGKKYLVIENDEKPDKPRARFLIQFVQEVSGPVREDIYGHGIGGPSLRISLKLRQKTK